MISTAITRSHRPASPEPNDGRRALLAFLDTRNAKAVPHSGKSLIDHLLAVEEILASWNAAPHVRSGGLFHSVYGTEHFRHAIQRPSDRDDVKSVIGEAAEHLAWLFGGLRFDSFFGAIRQEGGPVAMYTRWQEAPIDISEATLREIALIYAANWLEQFDRMRPKSRVGRLEDMRHLAVWLGGPAQERIEAAYGFNVTPLNIERRDHTLQLDQVPIEIWDDALPSEMRLRLSGLMDLNIWRYGWKASQEQTAYGFWHSHFGGDDTDASIQDCEHDLIGRPLVAPILELWRMLQAGPLQGHVPVRVYANGHTFGGDGHLHRDHTAPGHFTTIYYAHPEWAPNWAGETVFFAENCNEIIKAVFPKPGRLIHFPGHLLHAARSPSRECPTLRAVVVFKSRLQVAGTSE